MNYEHSIDIEDCLWRVTVQGEDTFLNRIGRLNEIISNPRWRPGSNVLEDCRGITLMDMDINEIFSITDIHAIKDAAIGKGKLAIVTNMGTVGSILQMWKSNTEERVSQEIRVFHDIESAEGWLHGHC
ncbi:MAG: hypothetical protein KKG47_04915 [Proteobacteria bacterium]|nr:hypothetical protein [Pseudomonadota bacterium]MBU1736627.1 hypothetical protein [Pseudomonadota bacterium]